MRGFIDWVFHLPNLMASSSILLLGSDPFSRENEEQNNQSGKKTGTSWK
ncbi:unnamed protein product, partial [Brassica napus]